MPNRNSFVTLPTIALDQTSALPLYRQLYNTLREAILAGQLKAGARLPATRALANALTISRNTVMNAYAQLLAEGYVEGEVGSGTYVARTLPDELLQARTEPTKGDQSPRGGWTLSRRGTRLASNRIPVSRFAAEFIAFRPGLPALDAFPYELWARLVARRWRRPQRSLLGYGDPAGYRPLRDAIAAYLGEARAVRCQAEQVIVVAGSQQALDLTARMLLDEGDAAWIEDPGYLGARGALLGAGAQLIPVPVDDEGLDVTSGASVSQQARLIYVTPSHQYPYGVTMSLRRRLALLEWASQTGAWVLEDDYDSEYRYAGRPLAALQGLDGEGRVIYLGTFSKVLFPALRLGYMVVPPDLVDAFAAARALVDCHSPALDQAALADFISAGHFARHIRRMRALYAERQALLVDAARHTLAGLLEVQSAEAGMHLVGWLPEGVDDVEASRRAAAFGVGTPPLSMYSLRPLRRGGLLLGFTAVGDKEIRHGVQRLAEALHTLMPGV
jgi:GntR family transcriptional regulator / MocR family aminotransferase